MSFQKLRLQLVNKMFSCDFAVKENKRLSDIIKDLGGLYGRQKEAIEKYMEYANIDVANI